MQPAVLQVATALDNLIISMPEAAPQGPVEVTPDMAFAAVEEIKAALASVQ